MARRRQFDDEDAAAEAMFLQRPQGGDMASQLATVLQLLGLSPQQEQMRQEAGLGRAQLEALRMFQEGQLKQTGAKTQSDIDLAKSQMALNEQLKKASTDEALARVELQKQQLANQATESRLGVLKQYMADPNVPMADKQKAWGEFDPAIQGMLAATAEGANKAKARELIPELQAVYGKPEQLKNLLARQSPEVLQRPEIPWGSMNEELWRQGQRTASGNAGLAGLLWNVPGMAQNVGKGLVNVASRGLMGSQAPQVPYTEFTNPVTEVPRYREAQAIMQALSPASAVSQGPVVGPAPRGRWNSRRSGDMAPEHDSPLRWKNCLG